MNKPTKMKMFTEAMLRGFELHLVEVGLIVSIAGSEFIWGAAWTPLLWVAAIAAVLWGLIACTGDAKEEAKVLLLDRHIYISDWVIGGLLMGVLSLITHKYGVQFSAIFLLAALQNLRYTALSYKWLREDVARVRNRNE